MLQRKIPSAMLKYVGGWRRDHGVLVFVQMGVELSTRHITRTRKGRNKERRRDGEKISLQDKGKSAVTK